MSPLSKRIAALERRRPEETPYERWLRDEHERRVALVAEHNAQPVEEWRAETLARVLPVMEILYGSEEWEERRRELEAEVAASEKPVWTVRAPGEFPPRDGVLPQDVLDILDGPRFEPAGGLPKPPG